MRNPHLVDRAPRGPLLDQFDVIGHVDDALHIDARGVDIVGVDLARLHQVLDLGDRDLAGGRHHGVKIARGLAKDEIALGIALPCMDQGDIGNHAGFHDIGLAIEDALFLTFGDHGAHAGFGEEGGDAGAAGADALGQRALGGKLDL